MSAVQMPIAEAGDLTVRVSAATVGGTARRTYNVNFFRCPRCASEMRIEAFITERSMINLILGHLRRRRKGSIAS